MNRIDKFLSECDARLDIFTTRFSQKLDLKFFYVTVSFFALLVTLVVGRAVYQKPRFIAGIITHDVQRLAAIINEIDKQCGILEITDEQSKLDFLTVQKFSGSEVGPLNLSRPAAWKGPYVARKPEIQGKSYELVKTRDGYFVVPGAGVVLPNGYKMGKQVVITPKTVMNSLTKKGGKLNYKGNSLATAIGDQSEKTTQNEPFKRTNEMLQELVRALPFAHSSVQFNEFKRA